MHTCRIANTDLTASRIAYGCGEIAAADIPIDSEGLALSSQLIHTACEQGITLFDLAAMYGRGNCETAFGQVLKRSPGLRDRLIIQTKCGAVLNRERQPQGDTPFNLDCSRATIVASAEASLKRLGTDRLDILLLHWPDMLARPEEIAAAFDDLHRGGKVRYFGVSNHTAWQIALLEKYVRQPLIINQIRLGLTHSYPIAAGLQQLQDWRVKLPHGHTGFSDILDFCRLRGIQIQAYSPLRGIKTHKLLNPPADASPQVLDAARVLADVAHARHAPPATIALAWLLHHPAEIVAVIGGKDPAHVRENCTATRVVLSREEWYRLFFSACGIQA